MKKQNRIGLRQVESLSSEKKKMIKDTKSTKEEYKYKATVRYNAIFILQASFRRLNPFNKKKKKNH